MPVVLVRQYKEIWYFATLLCELVNALRGRLIFPLTPKCINTAPYWTVLQFFPILLIFLFE